MKRPKELIDIRNKIENRINRLEKQSDSLQKIGFETGDFSKYQQNCKELADLWKKWTSLNDQIKEFVKEVYG